jgi:hypothetical protein
MQRGVDAGKRLGVSARINIIHIKTELRVAWR